MRPLLIASIFLLSSFSTDLTTIDEIKTSPAVSSWTHVTVKNSASFNIRSTVTYKYYDARSKPGKHQTQITYPGENKQPKFSTSGKKYTHKIITHYGMGEPMWDVFLKVEYNNGGKWKPLGAHKINAGDKICFKVTGVLGPKKAHTRKITKTPC